MKKKQTLIMVTIMSLLLSGAALIANETQQTQQTNNVYIAVPMPMFDRLTGNTPEKKAPETFIYQDGKLVKCEADLQSLQKPCRKNNNRENCREKPDHGQNKFAKDNKRSGRKNFNRRGGKPGYGGAIVLLTQAQINDLMKQKLEQQLKEIDNPDSKEAHAINEAVQNAPVVKVNGKDVKVINSMRLFKGHGPKCNSPQPPPPMPNE